MTTCLDTNVLSALLVAEQGASLIAVQLNAARPRGPLVIHVGVFAELLAAPDMTREHLEAFLQETGVRVDPEPALAVWEQASADLAGYSLRRQASGGGLPWRLLLDFLIGAHALHLGAAFFTLDPQHYCLAFPTLRLV